MCLLSRVSQYNEILVLHQTVFLAGTVTEEAEVERDAWANILVDWVSYH